MKAAKQIPKQKRAKPIPSDEQFLVVQESLRNGPRQIFYEEADAYAEAHELLSGKRIYPGYLPPLKLLVVKIVGAVVASTVTKRVKP